MSGPERREIQLIKRLQQFVPDALPVVRKASWLFLDNVTTYYGEQYCTHCQTGGFQYSPDNPEGICEFRDCYMANDSKGHFVTAKEAAKHNRQDVFVLCVLGCPLTLQRGTVTDNYRGLNMTR